jgi:hypothetical protein
MHLTHRDNFRIPILQALAKFGGRKKLEYLYPVIEEIMAASLTEDDNMLRINGRTPEPKWHTAVRAQRNDMKDENLLKPPDSNYPGLWQWTDAGRKYYEDNC